ncbi:cell division protein ZapA [Isoalcanivorax beigongshangi]|uniref:Cell division protein ZapA n=1 Tax=Isoalcanivorax beigongshangi TaxID=3238810 RepID=A0ABV4AJR5_9GAMM
MSEVSSVVVHLLDKEYRVSCPPGERDSLLRAARFLDERLRQVRDANVIGLERIAVMAALNLSHELLQTSHSLVASNNANDRLSRLLQKVDEELDAHRQRQRPDNES